MEKIKRFEVTSDLSEDYTINVAQRTSLDTPTHWHDFYEIDICLGGCGTTTINGKTQPFSEGYISLLTPVDFHSFSVKEELSILNLTFPSQYIEHSDFSELFALTKCICCQVSHKELERICFFVKSIETEIRMGHRLGKKYVSHLLACILIELMRLGRKDIKSETESDILSHSVQKIIFYVHSHFKDDISLESVAEFAGLSPGYVSKMFHKHFGYGFKELLTELRLKHAEKFLINSNESITDILYFSGFQSTSSFLRTFQKKHNMSPRSFRNKNRTNKN